MLRWMIQRTRQQVTKVAMTGIGKTSKWVRQALTVAGDMTPMTMRLIAMCQAKNRLGAFQR